MRIRHSLFLLIIISIPASAFASKQYVVKKGDSLYEISRKFGVTVKELKKTNRLSTTKLNIGDKLLIPRGKNSAASEMEYTVVKGDSLIKISNKFDVSVEKIKVANKLTDNKIKIGQKLFIPKSFASGTPVEYTESSSEIKRAKKDATTESSPPKSYEVKKGDSLYILSRKFGLSIDEIKETNNLTSDRLKIGEVITLSASPSENRETKVRSENNHKPGKAIEITSVSSQYKVKSGDTLSQIAMSFGVSVIELKRANGLYTNKIRAGKVLKIPGERENNQQVHTDPADSGTKYVVKKGDTLQKISNNFGVSIESIKSANNITGSTVYFGRTLIIPGKREIQKKVPHEYTVARGDTLSEISERFGISTDELKRANGLKNENHIKVGMKLSISDAGKPPPDTLSHEDERLDTTEYTVAKGDTLSRICRQFGVSLSELKRANRLEDSTIKTGTKLIIPYVNTVSPDSLSTKTEDSNVKELKTPEEIQDKTGVNVTTTYKKDENGLKEAKIRNDKTLTAPPVKVTIKEHEQDSITSFSNKLIQTAKRYLGAPYKFGGDSFNTGIDCSGYVKKVFGTFDVQLPRTAREIYTVGEYVDKTQLAKGDLVFFTTYASYPSHVGIYIGNDRFIHASSGARKVTITNINKNYYRRRYIGAKRIPVKGAFYEELSKNYRGFEKN